MTDISTLCHPKGTFHIRQYRIYVIKAKGERILVDACASPAQEDKVPSGTWFIPFYFAIVTSQKVGINHLYNNPLFF
jgi:hypothetical protein